MKSLSQVIITLMFSMVHWDNLYTHPKILIILIKVNSMYRGEEQRAYDLKNHQKGVIAYAECVEREKRGFNELQLLKGG